MPTKTTIARWISIIGSPFVLISLLVLTATAQAAGTEAALKALVVVAAAFIPLGLFMRHRHISGRWLTVDASAPGDRPALYAVSQVAAAALFFYFLYVSKLNQMARGVGVVAVMLFIAAFMNRWVKLSLHVSFAVFAGIVFLKLWPEFGLAVLLFGPCIFWSRLALGRHTAMEAICGVALGAAMSAVEWRLV
jgi:hypothetical protein